MLKVFKEAGITLLSGFLAAVAMGYFFSYSVGILVGSATLYMTGKTIYDHIVLSRIQKED